jgi:hypothetical protein
MANTIQIKRGLFASLPTLAAGELGLCTDATKRVFIGDGAANHEFMMKNLFAATSFLYAATEGAPVSKTPAETLALLSGVATADFSMNTHKITGVVDPTADQDVATKKYVDLALDSLESSLGGAGASTFLELTDTPADYTDDALKVVRVNSGANALEFVTFATEYLEGSPTEDLATKAPTSEWAFDHNAAATGVHGAGVNTLLHSGSTIDGGGFA